MLSYEIRAGEGTRRDLDRRIEGQACGHCGMTGRRALGIEIDEYGEKDEEGEERTANFSALQLACRRRGALYVVLGWGGLKIRWTIDASSWPVRQSEPSSSP